jgi:hypothetical protein
MAQVTITGSIKSIGKTQDVSATFKKRELVIIEGVGQRPAHIPIEFTQDRASMLDGFAPGEQVTVTAFVNGREWTGRDGVLKHFLSLSGNRIERVGAPAAQPMAAGNGAPPPSASDMPPAGEEDDLPF